MKWAGHVMHVEGRYRCRKEDNIKMDLLKAGCDSVDPDLSGLKQGAVESTVSITKLSLTNSSFSNKTLSHSYHFRFMFLYSKTNNKLFFTERVLGSVLGCRNAYALKPILMLKYSCCCMWYDIKWDAYSIMVICVSFICWFFIFINPLNMFFKLSAEG